MNVSIDGSEGPHRYRKNVVYRSLRRSSSQILTNIKKKINEAEKTVRYRRALRPLNESRSPSPPPQVRIIAPLPACSKRNVYTAAKVVKLDLDGYEFDNDSNILRTPDHSSTPCASQKKTGVIAQLREITTFRPLKRRSLQSNTPTAVRLSKQVARSRIREIQSPKKALLHFIHDNSIEEDMLPESSASQRSH